MLVWREKDRIGASNENTAAIVPTWLDRVITTFARESPRILTHRTAVVDVHVVLPHEVLARAIVGVRSCTPKLTPCTVMKLPPLNGKFGFSPCVMTGALYEKKLVAVPTNAVTVAMKPTKIPEPDAERAFMLVSVCHTVCCVIVIPITSMISDRPTTAVGVNWTCPKLLP